MARGKSENVKKWQMIRYVSVCFAWIFWLFATLSCISFHSSDPTLFGSSRVYNLVPPHVFNWCGTVGATFADFTLVKFGPGFFIPLVLSTILLYYWTKGEELTQWPLRLLGTVLLMGTTSALFFVGNFQIPLAELPGGMLGMSLGKFLIRHFNIAGTMLVLIMTFIVSLLLVADEFMLALPGFLMNSWQRMPRRQLAGVASTTAGSIWDNVRGFIDTLGNRNAARMGKKKSMRAGERESAKAGKGEAEKGKEAVSATATAVAEADGLLPTADPVPVEAAEPAATEAKVEEKAIVPNVRKPAVKNTSMPLFKPSPQGQKQDLGNYKLPGLELLDEPEPTNDAKHEARAQEKAKDLNSALESFHIAGKVEDIDTGPVVTLFEIGLEPGVKSAQVASLAKDIARALKSPPIRIIDNIPGKSTMGIEVPNLDRERVRLKELMLMGADQINRMQLPMCLGKDASGNPLIEDLTRMPHMLIAGTTGSGKSVCINSIIMTILLTQHPNHVKLIMVDPKMVEMQDYKSIPHLMAPIIDDMTKAESILEWATGKMDERYEIMSEASVRNIKDFNKLTREQIIERFGAVTEDDKAKLVFHLPYIVIIIDELADLMMTSKEVEGHIVRIAQKARAVGIHLILATQRPEAQVVTGLIKSNMPGRICFQVRSRLDSRIMLDQPGGELLLGQGDMMILKPTGGGLIRAQGAFVEDKEIKDVCNFLREIAQPEFHPELLQLGAAQGLMDGEEKDPLYNDAVDIMIESGRGSVSLIQRRLNIGYSRASRLIDQMRRLGIVGAYKGSMASEVTITKEEWEEMKRGDNASTGMRADGTEGSTGSKTGVGGTAGYAQQFNSTFEEDEEDDGVPDEMEGEHRM